MMEKIKVLYLSLLITENCNLKCRHCFRGENQNVDITDETIENTFSKVDEIGCLILTGGEPLFSLNTIDKIRKVISSIKKNNVIVHTIQLVTNGTIYSGEIEQVLSELYSLALNKNATYLLVSADDYHDDEIEKHGLKNIRDENVERFKNLSKNLEIKFKFMVPEKIAGIGRAKNLIGASEFIIESNYNIAKNFNDELYCAEKMSVFADGLVTLNGQIPYDLLTQYVAFNINDVDNISLAMARYSDDAINRLFHEGDIFEVYDALKERPSLYKLRCIFGKKD